MSLYIVTLAEMKAQLGITDSTDDAVLTIWMQGLQGRLDLACNRKFLYDAAVTEYFDGGETYLYAKNFPIASVTSVHMDADMAWGDDTLLASDGYRVNLKRGKIAYDISGQKWPEGFQNIRVIYAGGFVQSNGTAASGVSDNELQLLRRAFFLQMDFEWRNRRSLGMAQVSSQGVTIQQGQQVQLLMKERTLLPEVESMLTPLKRIL